VEQAVELGSNPRKGLALKEAHDEAEVGVRLWPVSRYRNYLILYRVESHRVRVLRILHAVRDWTRFFGND
jgi:plasmid stabilization system protein ParE